MIWIYKKDLENWQKLQNDLKSIRMTPNKKTENKLLTAVEWYTDELLGIKLEFAMGVISESEYHTKRHKAFEQARQMEKLMGKDYICNKCKHGKDMQQM